MGRLPGGSRVLALLRRRASDRATDVGWAPPPVDGLRRTSTPGVADERAYREQLQVIVSLLDDERPDEARSVALEGPWTPRPDDP